MQPAQLGGTGRHRKGMPVSVFTACAVRAAGAVVVGAEVDCFAAERAAVVDEFLVLLDGHVDWLCLGDGERVEDGEGVAWKG